MTDFIQDQINFVVSAYLKVFSLDEKIEMSSIRVLMDEYFSREAWGNEHDYRDCAYGIKDIIEEVRGMGNKDWEDPYYYEDFKE